MDHAEVMHRAIERAREGIAEGQTPFGACIVKDGEIIVCTHNGVWQSGDITAHAEMRAIREACHILATIDLSGCTIYSTVEPCPMCFTACHWARLDRIIYGAGIATAQSAGFNEMPISNEEMKRLGHSPVELLAGILYDECAALFDEWKLAGGKPY